MILVLGVSTILGLVVILILIAIYNLGKDAGRKESEERIWGRVGSAISGQHPLMFYYKSPVGTYSKEFRVLPRKTVLDKHRIPATLEFAKEAPKKAGEKSVPQTATTAYLKTKNQTLELELNFDDVPKSLFGKNLSVRVSGEWL